MKLIKYIFSTAILLMAVLLIVGWAINVHDIVAVGLTKDQFTGAVIAYIFSLTIFLFLFIFSIFNFNGHCFWCTLTALVISMLLSILSMTEVIEIVQRANMSKTIWIINLLITGILIIVNIYLIWYNKKHKTDEAVVVKEQTKKSVVAKPTKPIRQTKITTIEVKKSQTIIQSKSTSKKPKSKGGK